MSIKLIELDPERLALQIVLNGGLIKAMLEAVWNGVLVYYKQNYSNSTIFVVVGVLLLVDLDRLDHETEHLRAALGLCLVLNNALVRHEVLGLFLFSLEIKM